MARFIRQRFEMPRGVAPHVFIYDTVHNAAVFVRHDSIPLDVRDVMESDGICEFPTVRADGETTARLSVEYGDPSSLESFRYYAAS